MNFSISLFLNLLSAQGSCPLSDVEVTLAKKMEEEGCLQDLPDSIKQKLESAFDERFQSECARHAIDDQLQAFRKLLKGGKPEEVSHTFELHSFWKDQGRVGGMKKPDFYQIRASAIVLKGMPLTIIRQALYSILGTDQLADLALALDFNLGQCPEAELISAKQVFDVTYDIMSRRLPENPGKPWQALYRLAVKHGSFEKGNHGTSFIKLMTERKISHFTLNMYFILLAHRLGLPFQIVTFSNTSEETIPLLQIKDEIGADVILDPYTCLMNDKGLQMHPVKRFLPVTFPVLLTDFLFPWLAQVYFIQATHERKSGNDKWIKTLSKSVELDPSKVLRAMHLVESGLIEARVFKLLGEGESSAEFLSVVARSFSTILNASALSDENKVLYCTLRMAETYLFQGDIKSAEKKMSRLNLDEIHDLRGLLIAYEFYWKTKLDTEKEDGLFKRLLILAREKNINLDELLGQIYLTHGDVALAKATFLDAYEENPDSYKVIAGLSLVNFHEENWDVCEAYLDAGLQMKPDYQVLLKIKKKMIVKRRESIHAAKKNPVEINHKDGFPINSAANEDVEDSGPPDGGGGGAPIPSQKARVIHFDVYRPHRLQKDEDLPPVSRRKIAIQSHSVRMAQRFTGSRPALRARLFGSFKPVVGKRVG